MSAISTDGKVVIAALLTVAHAILNRTETDPGRPLRISDEDVFKRWQSYMAMISDLSEKPTG